MEGAVAEYEAAAIRFNEAGAARAEAEAFLKHVAAGDDALPLARAVLESSSVHYAQFQAAMLVRDVAIARWDGIAAHDREGMRSYLMGWVVDRLDSIERYVLRQVLQAVAVLWKRGWLEEPDSNKRDFFGNVASLTEGSLPHRLLAAKLFTALVEEFGSTKFSAMGMTLEFHNQSRASFQESGLPEVFAGAFSLLSGMAPGLCDAVAAAAPPIATGLPDGIVGDDVVDITGTALSVLVECLSWDFTRNSHGTGGSAAAAKSTSVTDYSSWVLRPGPTWREPLLGAGLPALLSSLYGSTRMLYATNVGRLCRRLIVQLSCLQGDVFADDGQRAAYCFQMCSVVAGILGSPLEDAIGPDAVMASVEDGGQLGEATGAEMLHMCQAWARLMHSFGFGTIAALENAAELITTLRDATTRLLSSAVGAARRIAAETAGGTSSPALEEYLETQRTYALEAVDALLDSWVEVVESPDAAAIAAAPIGGVVSEALGVVFHELVAQRVQMATATVRAGIDDDNPFEDPSAQQEHMESAAIIGRANAGAALQLLYNLVSQAVEKLRSIVDAGAGATVDGGMDVSLAEANEELYWLVQFSGYLLADECDGESPTVPSALNELSKSLARGAGDEAARLSGSDLMSRKFGEVSDDPVVLLAGSIFEFATMETNWLLAVPDGHGLSPLLSEQLLWFLQRWSATYLMPDPSLYQRGALSPTLTRVFAAVSAATVGSGDGAGELTGAESIVDVLVHKASIAAALWAFEPGVVEQSIKLLRSVVARRTLGAVALRTPSFQALVTAYTALMAGADDVDGSLGVLVRLRNLPIKSQRKLVGALVWGTASAGSSEEGEADQRRAYFDALVGPIVTQLRTVCESPQFSDSPFNVAAHEPSVLEEVERLLQVLRGVAESSSSVVPAEWLHELALPALSNALVFMDGYCARTRVSLASLKFAGTYLEYHLGMLPPVAAAPVYDVASEFLRVYAKHRTGAADADTGTEADMTQSELKALLRVLTHIIVKDDLDLEGGAEMSEKTANIILFGLNLIVPLVNEDMMQYPKLRELYLRIVSTVLSTYPDKVATLAGSELFVALVASLRYGVEHEEHQDSARASLEALYSMASYHAHAIVGGSGPGFSAAAHDNPGFFVDLAQLVLTSVVAPSFPSALLSPASNSLLALILCDQSAFHGLVDRLLSEQEDPTRQERLREAFSQLLAPDRFEPSLTRPARHAFQRAMVDFVAAVRGVIVIK